MSTSLTLRPRGVKVSSLCCQKLSRVLSLPISLSITVTRMSSKVLSISSFLGHIGFPFHFMLLHTHFVLTWLSFYTSGTVVISFSNTLFSYAKYKSPYIQFQMLSIVNPVSLCKVLYCRKLIRYCSFVFIVIYALYVPGKL